MFPDGSGGLLFGCHQARPHGVRLGRVLICNVTIEVIRGHGLQLAELAHVGRLFLIVRAPEVLHQVGLLPETVEAEDTLVGPHPGVSPEVDVDIGFGRQVDATDRTARVLFTRRKIVIHIGRIAIDLDYIVIVGFLRRGHGALDNKDLGWGRGELRNQQH